MWVGDLKVRFPWLVEGVHLWMDGDLMAGAQPAFCLERQTANTQTHKNRGILSMSDSLERSLVIMICNTVKE